MSQLNDKAHEFVDAMLVSGQIKPNEFGDLVFCNPAVQAEFEARKPPSKKKA